MTDIIDDGYNFYILEVNTQQILSKYVIEKNANDAAQYLLKSGKNVEVVSARKIFVPTKLPEVGEIWEINDHPHNNKHCTFEWNIISVSKYKDTMYVTWIINDFVCAQKVDHFLKYYKFKRKGT